MPIQINTTEHDHIPEEFTVESLKEGGMTDAEIEALASGDDPLLTIPEPEAEDDSAPAEQAAVGTPPEEAPQKSPETQAAPEPAPAPIPEPERVEIPDTDAIQQAIADADAKLEALSEQYDEGELTRDEFIEQQRELVKAQARAQLDMEQAQQTIEQAQQSTMQHWMATLDRYKTTAPELWSDQHIQGWDANLRAVTSNPTYADMTREAQIKLAHKLYAAEYEVRTGQSLNVQAAQPAPQTKKIEVSQDPKPEPVNTLAGYNSDGTSEIEDSTFAAIDRTIMKDPIAAEQAFDRMTPEQQERFLMEV